MVAVRAVLEPVLEDKSPFLLFTPAVMLAAAYGGVRVGVTAGAIGGVAGVFFLVGSDGLSGLVRSGRWLQPIMYLLVCAGVMATMDALRRARARTEAYAAVQARLASELKIANRSKDEFLATLSHELRTPMAAIVSWADLLVRQMLPADQVAPAAAIIHRNALSQNQLISDILDLARITSGKIRLDARRVDPAEPILAAVETVRPGAQSKRIALVPVVEHGTSVWADPDRLHQVFWNLLSNAVKFTPAEGRVWARLTATATHVHVKVIDTGPGLRTEFVPRAFERFRQDASAIHGGSKTGLGLGLAIVKDLVELQGGEVSAGNCPDGSGAVFEVVLPRIAPAALEESGLSRSEEDWLLRGLHVLVVDDDADTRSALLAALGTSGAHVAAAKSVGEAVALAECRTPDVVLTDIAMPDADGFDLLRDLQELGSRLGRLIPVAAVSAFAARQDRTRALDAGFMAYLAKPVDPTELVATVRSLAAAR